MKAHRTRRRKSFDNTSYYLGLQDGQIRGIMRQFLNIDRIYDQLLEIEIWCKAYQNRSLICMHRVSIRKTHKITAKTPGNKISKIHDFT
jgi:hypothetical protein